MTRDEQRAANRARFPEFAAITDRYPHMRLVWAKDADGEIGREPAPFPGIEVVEGMAARAAEGLK